MAKSPLSTAAGKENAEDKDKTSLRRRGQPQTSEATSALITAPKSSHNSISSKARQLVSTATDRTWEAGIVMERNEVHESATCFNTVREGRASPSWGWQQGDTRATRKKQCWPK